MIHSPLRQTKAAAEPIPVTVPISYVGRRMPRARRLRESLDDALHQASGKQAGACESRKVGNAAGY